jgi:hypothetical protein
MAEIVPKGRVEAINFRQLFFRFVEILFSSRQQSINQRLSVARLCPRCTAGAIIVSAASGWVVPQRVTCQRYITVSLIITVQEIASNYLCVCRLACVVTGTLFE